MMTLHEPALKAIAAAEPILIREARPADGEAIGRLTYEAFRVFHESRGFAPDFPDLATAVGLARANIADPTVFAVVAERGGQVVGANFLSEGDAIRGVGPIAVDPALQDAGVGRRLMQAVIDRGADALGIRLLQDAFNAKSMALYTALGFDPREPVALLTGVPRGLPPERARVRPMTPADLRAAAALCRRVHGFARTADLQAALAQGAPVVLERDGRITAYMAMPNLWIFNHAVAETEDDLRALILGAGAATSAPLGMLVPIRRAGLFRWCLDQGLTVVKPMTLMSRGHYAEPDGAWLPSVLY
jgi:predicted N-acetyltransferase YhbS